MLCNCFVASWAALPECRRSPDPHKPASRTVARSRSFSPEPLPVHATSRSREDIVDRNVHRKPSTVVASVSTVFEQDKIHKLSLDGTTSTDSDIASADSLYSDESLTDDEEKDSKIPDFTGNWKFSKIEGNFEAMMVDAGVSWAIRKMAKSANYGIGMARQEIKQNGSELVIQVHNGVAGTNTMQLIVDGSEQETVGEDGTSVLVTPYWKAQALHIAGKTKLRQRKIQESRRYLSGECMVIETVTSGGEVVLRYFSRI